MLLQFVIGLALVALLGLSVRRAAIRHDMSFQLVMLWFAGVGLLAFGLLALVRQDFLIETLGISTSAAATVAIGVLLTAITFRLSKAQGSAERMARETAMVVSLQGTNTWGTEFEPRSADDALIVIPAFNEETTIAGVVAQLSALDLRCVVVNDGSADRTSEVARKAGARVVDLPVNLGIGAALRVGWKVADSLGYSAAVQCDADGQHDPTQIPGLIDTALKLNAHLLIGSRFTNGMRDGNYETSLIRRTAMRLLASHASRVTQVKITDATSGFRCIRQPLLHEFARSYPVQYMESYESLVLAGKAGWNVAEVPSQMNERLGGTPSHGPLKSALFMLRVLMLRLIGSQTQISTPNSK